MALIVIGIIFAYCVMGIVIGAIARIALDEDIPPFIAVYVAILWPLVIVGFIVAKLIEWVAYEIERRI